MYSDGSDRRRYARIQIDQMIEMRFGQEQFIQAEGIDLSEKGLLCASTAPVDPQTRIFLMFQLPIGPEEREVQSEGIVVRSVKEDELYSVAVQFTDINAAGKSAIEAFLHLHAT